MREIFMSGYPVSQYEKNDADLGELGLQNFHHR